MRESAKVIVYSENRAPEKPFFPYFFYNKCRESKCSTGFDPVWCFTSNERNLKRFGVFTFRETPKTLVFGAYPASDKLFFSYFI